MAGRSVVYASGEDALFYVAEKLKRHLDGDREAIREGEKHLTITIDLHDEPHPKGREGSDVSTVTGPHAGPSDLRDRVKGAVEREEDLRDAAREKGNETKARKHDKAAIVLKELLEGYYHE